MRAQSHFRYEEVANLIAGLVNSGTLSPGSRAPSLREISKQQRISLSTALQAYQLLEDRGVLEARPQSGHYVTKRPAAHLATPGAALSPEDIVITSGCMEAITLALSVVTRPGDAVAVESPTYFGLLRALEALGLKVFELPTDATDGVDLSALTKVLERRSVKACLFSSSFNNPLGCTMPSEKKLKVLSLLARHRVPLVEDDINGDIYFGSERPVPFTALDRNTNTIIYCSSFSKTIAPGYRIGWMATKTPAHMQSALERKLAFTLSGPPLLQIAFAEFLSSGGYDNHLRRIRRVFEDTIGQMSRAVERSFPEGTKVSRPAGNFVLWLELPKSVQTATLFDKARDNGICFVPGHVFSASGRYGHCLRLSCGHGWNERIEKGVTKLGKLVSDAAARTARQ